VKVAVVMGRLAIDATTGRARLAAAGGVLRRAID
jgi:N-acetylmuramic acid 6-phosphate (MurNAc-6-P) etherase